MSMSTSHEAYPATPEVLAARIRIGLLGLASYALKAAGVSSSAMDALNAEFPRLTEASFDAEDKAFALHGPPNGRRMMAGAAESQQKAIEEVLSAFFTGADWPKHASLSVANEMERGEDDKAASARISEILSNVANIPERVATAVAGGTESK